MQPDHAHIAPLKNLLRSHFGPARANLNFYGLLLLLLDMMQPDEPPDAIKSSRQDLGITTSARTWRDQRTEKVQGRVNLSRARLTDLKHSLIEPFFSFYIGASTINQAKILKPLFGAAIGPSH